MDGTSVRSLTANRSAPAVAQTDRVGVVRWLPALDLGDGCSRLLAAVAEPEGCWVWHVYEDLGDGNLAAERLPWRLEAAAVFLRGRRLPGAPPPPGSLGRLARAGHGGGAFSRNLPEAPCRRPRRS